jgi:hypothetical protein
MKVSSAFATTNKAASASAGPARIGIRQKNHPKRNPL